MLWVGLYSLITCVVGSLKTYLDLIESLIAFAVGKNTSRTFFSLILCPQNPEMGFSNAKINWCFSAKKKTVLHLHQLVFFFVASLKNLFLLLFCLVEGTVSSPNTCLVIPVILTVWFLVDSNFKIRFSLIHIESDLKPDKIWYRCCCTRVFDYVLSSVIRLSRDRVGASFVNLPFWVKS